LGFFFAEELLMVDKYEKFDWCIFYSLLVSNNMHQSKFSYLSTIKSSPARKITRKKMVEHWSLKQMSSSSASKKGTPYSTPGLTSCM
jgi:hypothetical protein